MTREIGINLSRPVRMVHQFLPHLKSRKCALVVNVSSGHRHEARKVPSWRNVRYAVLVRGCDGQDRREGDERRVMPVETLEDAARRQ